MTMMTKRTTAMLGFVVAMSAEVSAQSRSSVGVTFAATHDAQRNPGASPYAYSGGGMSGELRYARWNQSAAIDVRLGASFSTLRSAITAGGRPIEELNSGTISAAYLRPLGDSIARLRWQIGGRLAARFAHTTHVYATPFTYSDDFGFFIVGLGPELHASLPVRRSRLTNRLSVPLLNLIDYPYSNLKASTSDVSVAFPPKAVALENELVYRVGAIRRRGIAWRYQLSFLRYDLADARLFAQQLVGLEVSWVFGGGPW